MHFSFSFSQDWWLILTMKSWRLIPPSRLARLSAVVWQAGFPRRHAGGFLQPAIGAGERRTHQPAGCGRLRPRSLYAHPGAAPTTPLPDPAPPPAAGRPGSVGVAIDALPLKLLLVGLPTNEKDLTNVWWRRSAWKYVQHVLPVWKLMSPEILKVKNYSRLKKYEWLENNTGRRFLFFYSGFCEPRQQK